jgi:hypothetical protein
VGEQQTGCFGCDPAVAKYTIESYILPEWIPQSIAPRRRRSKHTRPVLVITDSRQNLEFVRNVIGKSPIAARAIVCPQRTAFLTGSGPCP